MLGDPDCDFQHKDGPKITQVNEWPFFRFASCILISLLFLCSCKTYTVCCCPWLRPSSPGPVMDQTGSRLRWDRNRNIMNYGPCTAAASWPWVVLLETPVLSTTCQDELLHAPPADAGLGQGTRRRPGHLKKSVLTFSGTLKIFTVWRLNFSPENCPEWPGRRALSPDIYWVWPEIAKLELCWAD